MNDDELLRHALERLAPPASDVTAARARLEQLAPAYRRARTVHRVRVGVVSALGALGLVAGSLAVMGSLQTPSTPTGIASPAEETAPVPGPDDGGPSPDVSPDADVTSTTPEHLEVTGSPDTTGAVEAPGSSDDGTGSAGGHATTPSMTTPSPTATPSEPSSPELPGPSSPGADLTVGTSPGGTASVRVVDGNLELVSTEPAPGFTAEVTETKHDEIKVKFASEDSTYEVTFDLDHGEVTVKTETKKPKGDHD
ncbi:MAG: hypothetical protein D6683_07945 [Actinomyces sp.]|nr:MAG: hypothetical protein D6683_07945 [Actinomyces sp.]